MKTILRTLSAIGFGLAALIASVTAVLMTGGSNFDGSLMLVVGIASALLGGLSGWYRVR